jgi:hypothetical protein
MTNNQRRLHVLLNHIIPISSSSSIVITRSRLVNDNIKKNSTIKKLLLWLSRYDQLQYRIIVRHFSMMEILISVGIMVSISSIVGTKYYEKILESKATYAKIELDQIAQAIVFFYAQTGHYPLSLTELSEFGSISSLDPWKQAYVYIPRVDWLAILEILDNQSVNEREMKYWLECLQVVARELSALPQNIDPTLILTLVSSKPIVFSVGYREKPIFPSNIEREIADQNMMREKMRQTIQFIKVVREKASGNSTLQHVIDGIQSRINKS